MERPARVRWERLFRLPTLTKTEAATYYHWVSSKAVAEAVLGSVTASFVEPWWKDKYSISLTVLESHWAKGSQWPYRFASWWCQAPPRLAAAGFGEVAKSLPD